MSRVYPSLAPTCHSQVLLDFYFPELDPWLHVPSPLLTQSSMTMAHSRGLLLRQGERGSTQPRMKQLAKGLSEPTKLESQSICSPSRLTPVASLGVPKTTLQVINSLAGPRTHCMLLDSWLWFTAEKRYRLRSVKGRNSWGSFQESSKCSFYCLIPLELGIVLLSQHQCVTTCTEYLPTRDAPPTLGVQSFYWGFIT